MMRIAVNSIQMAKSVDCVIPVRPSCFVDANSVVFGCVVLLKSSSLADSNCVEVDSVVLKEPLSLTVGVAAALLLSTKMNAVASL
jgi:hypothetical protein